MSNQTEENATPEKPSSWLLLWTLIPWLLEALSNLRGEIETLREELKPKSDSDALLTREEAANRLAISTRTLDDLEASGRLQAVRIGRRVLYHPETLDSFIRAQSREDRT